MYNKEGFGAQGNAKAAANSVWKLGVPNPVIASHPAVAEKPW